MKLPYTPLLYLLFSTFLYFIFSNSITWASQDGGRIEGNGLENDAARPLLALSLEDSLYTEAASNEGRELTLVPLTELSGDTLMELDFSTEAEKDDLEEDASASLSESSLVLTDIESEVLGLDQESLDEASTMLSAEIKSAGDSGFRGSFSMPVMETDSILSDAGDMLSESQTSVADAWGANLIASSESDYLVAAMSSDTGAISSLATNAAVSSLEGSSSSYTAASTSSSSTSTRAPFGVYTSSGGGALVYATDAAPYTAEKTYTKNVDYVVKGHTKLIADDYLRFDSTVIGNITGDPTSSFNLHVRGEYLEGQAPTLDGEKTYRGFEILFKTYNPADVTIEITGVTELKNFIVNHTSHSAGAALCLINGGQIIFHNTGESDRVVFSNNHVITSKGHASGGAIFLSGGASVSDLHADFINNSTSSTDRSSTVYYSRGGAIAVGISDTDNVLQSKNSSGGYDGFVANATQVSSIGNIYGDFKNNSSSFGGAIYTGAKASIGHIEGNFIDNLAEGWKETSHTSGAEGGAIRTYFGTFGSIHGDFEGNVAHALSGNAIGGAVSLTSTDVQGDITGHFDGNIAAVDADTAFAHGGAYSLKNQSGDYDLIFRDASFTNNVSATTSSDSTKVNGGAFYISNSRDVSFIADQENVVFSGNYVTTKTQWTKDHGLVSESDAVRISSGIYAVNSSVSLETTAGSDKTITFNDGVYGISTGTDSSKLTVNGAGTAEYDVIFNDYIAFDDLIINSGGVELGRHTQTYTVNEKNEAGEIVEVTYNAESQGSFVMGANVTVNEGGVLKAHASSFDGVGEIDLNGTTDQAGTLKLTGGTLKTNIGASGEVREGHIDLIGEDTTIASGFEIYADTLELGSTLIIQSPETVESLMNDTFVSVQTILFSGYDKNDINNGGSQVIMEPDATLRFHELNLEIGTAAVDDVFELVVSSTPDVADSIDVYLENFTTSVFAMDGEELVQNVDYVIEYRTDGGVQIRMLVDVPAIPEPSTAVLSLLALTGLLARRRRKQG